MCYRSMTAVIPTVSQRPGRLASQESMAEPPMEPNFAIFKLPYSDLQSDACTEGFREVADSLEGRVEIPRSSTYFRATD